MPKVILSPTTEMCATVMRNICAQAEIRGFKTDCSIAKKLGMSTSTFSVRRQRPNTLKLEEIVKASTALKCSLAWLVTEHKDEFKEVISK